jgi:RNA polymerase sigma factor (TIGR02999 family)
MDQLMKTVYDDLERIAASQLRRQFGDAAGQLTLEPRSLVNESYMRLIKQRKTFDNRGQFFAIATRVMLRVLLDYRRQRLAAKRGAGLRVGLTLDLADQHQHARADARADDRASFLDIEAFDQALTDLDRLSQRKCDIVRMRVIWNMTIDEIAESLDISPSSVDRDWRFAKAWIAAEVERITGQRSRERPADDPTA